MKIDLLIINAQIATCAAPHGPKRRAEMQEVGLIKAGAVAVKGADIVDIGPSAELQDRYQARRVIDAGGCAVCPGFVDPHTHVIYAGDRVDEFEQRLRGASYMEILQAGGGILNTMEATRRATAAQLAAETRPRLDAMLTLGTTTVEVKTGYGLDPAAEMTMLQAMADLDQAHSCELVPTFMGAHALPPEHKMRPDDYLDLVIDEMLPAAAHWYAASPFARREWPFFCDVFCEDNVFDVPQSRRVLEAGLALGLKPKLHADEFVSLGGTALAVEVGATSVDHLDVTPPPEIEQVAESGTIGVVLPAVNFNLGSTRFAPARQLIEAGAALALATDINPGSAPCPSMPLVMALACRYQKLLPAEALNAATINAAHAVGLGYRLGSLEAGKQADILILKTADYRHLAYQFGDNLVAQVIKKGQVL